jgi:hypothetical protein
VGGDEHDVKNKHDVYENTNSRKREFKPNTTTDSVPIPC